MQYIGYLFFRLVIILFSFFSIDILYKVADFLAWLLYKGIGYRKEVVFKQLRDSFPEKSEMEIERIARASYQNMADVIVESIKGFSMKEADFRRHYAFLNPSVSNDFVAMGQNVIHVAAHYCNWEWGAISYPLHFFKPIVGFYKPLSNKFIEKYSHAQRSMFGLDMISIGQTSQAFEDYKNKPTVYAFVTDQSTSSDNAHWVTFLGQDTACLYGADKYARATNAPVFYVGVQRVRRGYYEVQLELIAENSASLPVGEVTRRFMARLEKVIHAKPEDWLWSHKRWKKKRSKDDF